MYYLIVECDYCIYPHPTIPSRSIPSLGLRSRQWSKIGTAGETWLLMMSVVLNILAFHISQFFFSNYKI